MVQNPTSNTSEAGGHWLRRKGSSQEAHSQNEFRDGSCRLTSANATPVHGCNHGFGALEENARGGVSAGLGEMDRRRAFPAPSHLLDDAEGLLVSGDEVTQVPAYASHIISLRLKEV